MSRNRSQMNLAKCKEMKSDWGISQPLWFDCDLEVYGEILVAVSNSDFCHVGCLCNLTLRASVILDDAGNV
jgi:hypothetical protein